MALTQYCSASEVRATVGANELELPDPVLALPIYEIGLLRELSKVSESLPATFSAINEKPEASRTDAEKALFAATRLFSNFVVSRQVGVSLAARLPKSVSDGKAAVSRFSGEPYKDTLARIDQYYASARSALIATLDEFGTPSSATVAPTLAFVAVQRGYDPVTGEG